MTANFDGEIETESGRNRCSSRLVKANCFFVCRSRRNDFNIRHTIDSHAPLGHSTAARH
jgi:hypothetical protein